MLAEQVRQRVRVDARHGNVGTEAVNHQGEHQEHETALPDRRTVHRFCPEPAL